MTEANVSGMVYAVKNVGDKITIDVSHPMYGSTTIEAVLPMVDPIFVDIHFTGKDRAYLTYTVNPELGAFAPRVGHWQLPAVADTTTLF